MSVFRVSYDPEVDTSYISLAQIGPGDAVRQETHGTDFVLDFDADGRLLGLEVFTARSRLVPDLLAEARGPEDA